MQTCVGCCWAVQHLQCSTMRGTSEPCLCSGRQVDDIHLGLAVTLYIAYTNHQPFLGHILNAPCLWSPHQSSVDSGHVPQQQVTGRTFRILGCVWRASCKCWLGTDFMLRKHFSFLILIATECSQQPSQPPLLVPQARSRRVVLLKQCLPPASLLIHV